MIHKTTIVVIITTCIIAFIMIVTFHINIFQVSVMQILSLMITLASCSVVVSLLTHLFDLPKNPILEFDGVIKVRDGVLKTEYYLRVAMVKGEGDAEKCMGRYSIADDNYQTPSVWRDSSRASVISKNVPKDLLLFSVTCDEQSHKWVVLPKMREEDAYNFQTKELTVGEIKESYEEYCNKIFNVAVTASNINETLMWSKRISEIIQTAK
jgi:hypothetical protein